MPPIQFLNAPPNPFWQFVADLEDHPLFASYARPPTYTSGDNVNAGAAHPETPPPAAEPSEKAKGKQPSVEDPPEVDPATLNSNEQVPDGLRDVPFRGRGRFASAFSDGPHAHGPEHRRGQGCRGRGDHQAPHGGPMGPPPWVGGPMGPPPGVGGPMGPPPWVFGSHGPWWARRGPAGEGHHESHGPGHRGARGWGHRGGPHGRPGHREMHRGGADGFNLGEFLNNLGQRLGVDLTGAAEGLGLDRFTTPRANQDTDFEPRADVFESAEKYTVHISLPGAKKEDVGLEYDGENSVLRVAGVVHRPDATEEMLSQLVVDGRKREVGVFEKAIRLGTRRDPASIDVNGIAAKMQNGVLVIHVPKVEVEHKKREVPITSHSNSPARRGEKEADKENLMDVDDPAPPVNTATAEKEAEYQRERSETLDHQENEKLPEYVAEDEEEEEWEKDDAEEGEYVKINVD